MGLTGTDWYGVHWINVTQEWDQWQAIVCMATDGKFDS